MNVSCTVHGGALMLSGGTAMLSDTRVVRATAGNGDRNGEADLNGGAIYILVGSVMATNVTFAHCFANVDGGTLMIQQGTMRLTDVLIVESSAGIIDTSKIANWHDDWTVHA